MVYEVSDTQFQIMDQVAEKINMLYNNKIAIIYDRQGCHVYDGDKCVLILEADIIDMNKDVLLDVDYNEIVLTQLSEEEELGYTARPETRVQTTWNCGVSYITQNPYHNICWAATTACITNYLKGTSHTAVSIVRDYFNSSNDFDRTLSSQQSRYVLWNYLEHDIEYIVTNGTPSDSCILNNIMQKYPIYAVFEAETSNGDVISHATTLYGYALTGSGTIWIMDPLRGSVIIEKDAGGYSYLSSNSNVEMELIYAMCVIPE